MPLTINHKQEKLSRICDYTDFFRKDWKHLTNIKCYNMDLLKEAISLLISNGSPLPGEWEDYALTGNWDDHRGCHVGSNVLLIYRVEQQEKQEKIVFVRAGMFTQELSANITACNYGFLPKLGIKLTL